VEAEQSESVIYIVFSARASHKEAVKKLRSTEFDAYVTAQLRVPDEGTLAQARFRHAVRLPSEPAGAFTEVVDECWLMESE
jgi:hypothetical protein